MGNLVDASRDTSASPEAVWALLVDVDHAQTHAPHLKEAHLDHPLQVGATGWIQTKIPLPRTSFTVTSFEEGRSWAWRGKVMWLTMDVRYRCDPTDTGCRVGFDVSLDGSFGGLVRPIARLIYGPQMERALDLLVEHAASRS